MLSFDPDIFQDDFIEKSYINAADVNVDIHPSGKVVCQPVGEECLYRLGLNGQVKARQQQKEDRQRDEDYFPAFFDNFAF